jgi:hypothetical protein
LFQLTTVLPVIFSVNDPISKARAITNMMSTMSKQIKILIQSQFKGLNSLGGAITSEAAKRNNGLNRNANIATNLFENEFMQTLSVSTLIFIRPNAVQSTNLVFTTLVSLKRLRFFLSLTILSVESF